jgi:hypothetical protein
MQNFDRNIGFREKRQFFRRKLSKFAENCDHNIDPWSVCKIFIFFKSAHPSSVQLRRELESHGVYEATIFEDTETEPDSRHDGFLVLKVFTFHLEPSL